MKSKQLMLDITHFIYQQTKRGKYLPAPSQVGDNSARPDPLNTHKDNNEDKIRTGFTN